MHRHSFESFFRVFRIEERYKKLLLGVGQKGCSKLESIQMEGLANRAQRLRLRRLKVQGSQLLTSLNIQKALPKDNL